MFLLSKKNIALLILGGGALAALLIAVLVPTPHNGGELTFSSGKGGDPAFAFDGSASAIHSGSTNSIASSNLTDLVIQRYGGEILKLNLPGSGGGRVLLPNEATLDNIVREAITGGFLFKKVYVAKDFRANNDNAPHAVQRYLETLGEELEAHEEIHFLPAIATAVADTNTRPLEQYAGQVENYLQRLLVMVVPSEWIPFHIKFANMWNERAELSRAILAIENDPLRTIAALHAIPKTAEKESEIFMFLEEFFRKTS